MKSSRYRVAPLAAAIMVTLPLAAKQPDRTFENASADFIQHYLQAWSQPAPVAIAYMDQIYPDHVEFYGRELTHAALMTLKRKFVVRWPERRFALRADSVLVNCDGRHLCVVEAMYDWTYRNEHDVSTGTATLRLELQDGMTIVKEDGSVLSQGAPEQPPAATVAKQQAPAQPPKGSTLTPQGITPLRADYEAHARDPAMLTAWMQQTRPFAGEGIYKGEVDDRSGAGPSGVMHTFSVETAGGQVSCINPAHAADSLRAGQKVNVRGTVGLFITDVMFLNACSIEPVA